LVGGDWGGTKDAQVVEKIKIVGLLLKINDGRLIITLL
jgi:hypothetical protein